MLLGFSASLAWFNNADLGLSVPMVYPFMAYLLVRMLLLAAGRGRPREPLRVAIPTAWLAILLIFIVGFRIGLNVANSNVIDVGYAGVIGADKIVHDKPLYGNWPADNPSGDTSGRSTTSPTCRSARSGVGAVAGIACRPRTLPRSPSTC